MGKYGCVLPKYWAIFTVKWQEKGAPEGAPKMRWMAYFLRERTAMPRAETAMRATAAATMSLAPVEGFF